ATTSITTTPSRPGGSRPMGRSRMSKSLKLFCGSVLAASVLAGPAMAEKLGLGREALPEEISAWDTAVLPDGQGLRPGSGDVMTGDEIFADNCASCHGDFAEGLDS